jgi:hypothetical protein
MNRDQLKEAVQKGMIEWQIHALERMMKRGISRKIVKHILLEGKIIENLFQRHYFWGGFMENRSMW